MFEPRVFDERAQGQDALMDALVNRDMEAFERALADPDVDPNYWYGKPYWSTCLQWAAKSAGCEAFVLALLRAGAGDLRHLHRGPLGRPRPSDAASRTAAERIAKLIADADADGDSEGGAPPVLNGDLDEYLELLLSAPAGGCVCGAQAAAAAAAAAAATETSSPTLAAGAEAAEGGGAAGAAGAGAVGGGGGGAAALALWLREISRALRDTADHMRRELRGVAQRVDQLGERLAAVERAQQRTNEILLHLKR